MSNNIIWLASYPKSGNTWCRALISNLLNDATADINQLQTDGIASARGNFENTTLINSTHLSYDEIDIIRPQVYDYQSNTSGKSLFIKVHDAYTLNVMNNPIFPVDASKGVVYIVRNPLDVAISYAAHNNFSIDRAIELLNDSDHCIEAKATSVSSQFRQKLLNWSEHATSWLTQREIPLLLIRYEDLHTEPLATVHKLANFSNLPATEDALLKSLRHSDLAKLQQQEQTDGFREKPQNMSSFFRRGIVGNWRQELTLAQVQLIIKHHRPTMERLGYL